MIDVTSQRLMTVAFFYRLWVKCCGARSTGLHCGDAQ